MEDAKSKLLVVPAGGAPAAEAAASALGVPVVAISVAWRFGGGVGVSHRIR